MITYTEACEIARAINKKDFQIIYVAVTDICDRWAFVFSIYAPDDEHYMTPAPSFFVYKADGHVEWYSVPPLENLEVILTGKEIAFLEEA